MNYNHKISQLEVEIKRLKDKQTYIIAELKKLKIGDTVYVQCSHGLGDDDYFPQEILAIDFENCSLEVFEKSINQKSTIDFFYVYDEEKNEYRPIN